MTGRLSSESASDRDRLYAATMRNTLLRIEDFDSYDRFVLWTALTLGFQYVEIKKGPQGYWLADLSSTGQIGTPDSGPVQLLRLDEIEGLTASSRQPAVEPGPWLRLPELR